MEEENVMERMPAKMDCFAYNLQYGKCNALNELVCAKNGKCPFYKLMERKEDKNGTIQRYGNRHN